MRDMTAMPRWFWLLPVVAMAAWWPIGAYWASDDFIAIAYSQHLGRAASDLIAPQYGATDVWSFYRPLITLSFWFDQTIGGVWPPLGHCSNVVAHGCSTLLVALIWRRFLSDGQAFGAAFLWAIMPSHVGSIAWAVGRVDSHTTVWCLLALVLFLRTNERRAAGDRAPHWPAVVATALALMSKELAFVVPPLCTWLGLMQSRAKTVAENVRDAVRMSWPIWALFAAYLPFRLLVLGKFGGYDASSLPPEYDLSAFGGDAMAKVAALGTIVCNLLVPLKWIGMQDASATVPTWSFLVGAGTPIAIALLLVLTTRPRRSVLTLLAFVCAMAPMVTFWTADSPHSLRYYYLPSVALVGLLAGAGRWPVIAIAIAWLWPLIAVRSEQFRADQQSSKIHAALLREAKDVPDGPMFVAGLPHSNVKSTAVQLHFGIDRMLQPPFCVAPVPLFALRPLLQSPGAFRIVVDGEPPFALPAGSTWWFPDATALGRAPEPAPLPELVIAGDSDDALDITTDRLMPLIETYRDIKLTDRDSFGLTMPGVKGPFFRVTLFTANGYLCCICKDHSKPSEAFGRLDIVRFLARNYDPVHQYDVARLLFGDSFLADALPVPTTIDLVPEFPTLIEAGTFDLQNKVFTPSHRARRMIVFRFDRSYPDWVRKAQGK